jgi:tRNA (adenine37-N6)-methyltransferase
MMDNTFKRIGIIQTPFKMVSGMPVQSALAKGIKGTVVLDDEFADGLLDLDGFSHIILIYSFHQSTGYELHVVPFLDQRPHGIFATRAPKRPNKIGISVVKLIRVEGNILEFENADMLDGTPLLDIKPYIPEFDVHVVEKTGWMGKNKESMEGTLSDERFL